MPSQPPRTPGGQCNLFTRIIIPFSGLLALLLHSGRAFYAQVLFCAGLALLDTFDHYTINYALFLTGAAEAYVISWVWGWRETADKCGTMCARLLTFGYTGAPHLLMLLFLLAPHMLCCDE